MRQTSIIKKVILWRIISFTLATIVTYIFIGQLRSSIYLSLTINGLVTIVHYFFEKWWERSDKMEVDSGKR